MIFVADESVDAQIVYALRSVGHAILYITEQAPSSTDQEVLKLAHQNQALLLTADKDFGELVYRRQEATHGVLLLRVHGLPPERKSTLVVSAVQTREKELYQAFSVLTEHTLRIRRL